MTTPNPTPNPSAENVIYVQAPPKKRRWPWILLALVVVVIALIGGCVALVGKAVNDIDKEQKKEITVTYLVTGGQRGSVTYTQAENDTAQEDDVALPWKKEVKITGFLKFAQLLAQNGMNESGAITCTIKVGDKVISTTTSRGAGVMASCSGSVGKDD